MPIEFRCTQCDKLLRTGDDTAGKQAKCPECGTVMTIPMPDQGTVPPSQPQGSFEAAPSPFAAPPAPVPPDSENPYQSPASAGPDQRFFAPPGEIRPARIEFGETLSRTWAVFTDKWLPVLGAVALIAFINIVASFTMQGIIAGIAGAVQDAAVAGGIAFLVQVLYQIMAIWLGIGLQLFTLGVVRGEEARFGLLFAGGPYLLSVILVSLLIGLVVILGLILFIIPGIIFALMLAQAQLLIIDRKMGVIDAMSTSRDVMAGNKMTVFAIGIVAGFVGLLFVLITCGLGYLAVGPYMMILSIVIYLGVTGQPTMADRYAMPQEQSGGTPFGPTPGTPSGDSPFTS